MSFTPDAPRGEFSLEPPSHEQSADAFVNWLSEYSQGNPQFDIHFSNATKHDIDALTRGIPNVFKQMFGKSFEERIQAASNQADRDSAHVYQVPVSIFAPDEAQLHQAVTEIQDEATKRGASVRLGKAYYDADLEELDGNAWVGDIYCDFFAQIGS